MPGYGRGRGRGAGRGPGDARGRRRGGGRGLRRLLEPVLLLQLHRGASHGYGLLDGLEEFALERLDASVVYRVLREMELAGWVDSTWDELQTQGPPRRVYQLTEEGERVLEQWTRDLEDWRLRIDRFLGAYRKRATEGGDGEN